MLLEKHLKACASAHAKKEMNVCQFTDVNGKCLDEEGGLLLKIVMILTQHYAKLLN